MSKLSIQDL